MTRLLDDEGDLTEEVVICLKHIFAQYCTPSAPTEEKGSLRVPPENSYLTNEGLDAWARDTNGAPLSDEQKEDLQMLDVTDDGYLTLRGFLEVYQLQTSNDEDETWKDLAAHGFDKTLTRSR